MKAFRLDVTPEQAAELAAQLGRLAHANLTHPSIVTPLDAGLEASVAYLASDFVSAESLDAAVRQYGPAPLAQAMLILTSIAAALDFAAAAGIQHGALHPRDVLVSPDDTHITGLGVGRALETIGLRAAMRRPYVAPERVQRESWDARADVYSLAVLAREMLVGRSRLERETDVDPRVLEEQADRVVPVLAKATAARPADRFATSLDFVGALQEALDGTRIRPAAALPPEHGEPRRARDVRPKHPTHDLLLPLDDAVGQPVDAVEADGRAEADAQPFTESAPLEADRIEPADALGQLQIDADRTEAVEAADAIGLSDVEDGVMPDDAVSHDGRLHEPALADRVPGHASALTHDELPFAREREAETEPLAARPSVAATPLGVAGAGPETSRVAGTEPARGRRRSWGMPLLIVGLVLGALGGYLLGLRQADRAGTPSAVQSEPAAPPLSQVAPGPAPTAAALPPAGQGAEGRGNDANAQRANAAGSGGAAAGAAKPVPGTVAPAPAPDSPARAPAKINGVLVVRSSPSGASVTVNGRRRGATPLQLRNLPAGKYTVSVSRRGYATEQREAVLSADRSSSTLTFALKSSSRTQQPGARTEAADREEPSTAAEFYGSLSVESLPSGAQVFLDGKLIGTTPLASARVPAGSHVLRVNRTGFQPWTTAIQVVSGQRVRVTASLERESA